MIGHSPALHTCRSQAKIIFGTRCSVFTTNFLFLWSFLLSGSLLGADWEAQVRAKVQSPDLSVALGIVEKRLAESPEDYDAAIWHARLVAWSRHWDQAESEYLRLLERHPENFDATIGLVDVLLWERRVADARARLATLLPKFQDNPEVRRRLARLEELRVEELPCEIRSSYRAETFSFAESAHGGLVSYRCGISRLWKWQIEADSRSRFGQFAQRYGAGAQFRRSRHGFYGSAARSSHSEVFPLTEGEIGYSLGLPRLEIGYAHRWLSFEQVFVHVANPSFTMYLPRQVDLTFSLFVSQARFETGEAPKTVSGLARLAIPARRNLRFIGLYAIGAESFRELTLDRAGRFSAKTFGAGLRWEIHPRFAIEPLFEHQLRHSGERETAFALGYSWRF